MIGGAPAAPRNHEELASKGTPRMTGVPGLAASGRCAMGVFLLFQNNPFQSKGGGSICWWSAGRPRPAASLPDGRDARRSIARLLPPESVTHSAASVILYRPYYGYFNSEHQRERGSRHH